MILLHLYVSIKTAENDRNFPQKIPADLLNSKVQLIHLKGLSIDVEVLWNHGFYNV